MEKWPKMDLGPIESVLGIPARPEEPPPEEPPPEEPPPEEPPPEEPPKPPILLPSDNRFFAPLADGILYASNPGIQMINKSISESDFGGEIITVFEIKTQEGCDSAMEAYIKVGSFEIEQVFKAFGDFFSSGELPSLDEDFVQVDWRYEIGDRVFTYVAGGGGWAVSEKLFVCKRQGQIFYIGDLDEKWFSEFKKHFNIDPLS